MIFQNLRLLARPTGLRYPVLNARLPRPGALQRSFTSSSRQQAYIRFSTPGEPQKPRNPYDWRRWDPKYKFAAVAVGLGGVYYVAHLEQVPDTGRWRFMNTSPGFEAKFGEAARQQIRDELGSSTLPPNHPISRHVRRVVSRILTASNLGVIRGDTQPSVPSPFGMSTDPDGNSWNPDADAGAATNPGAVYGPSKEWDVIVVNDKKMINAMASPGIVIVFTGILPICQDEQGLAAVLAHEVGHVVARHSAERLSSQTVLFGIIILLQIFGLDWGFSNLMTQVGLELPNSRKQELEADLIGLRLMSRACYDPAAAPKMFSRLAEVESKLRSHVNLAFLQTHPSSESRVKYLEARLNEGYSIMAENPECSGVRQYLEDFRKSANEAIGDEAFAPI